MSQLSEAEKRKLLRERRQQKFLNGGGSSRLNKITGQISNSQLSTELPIDLSQPDADGNTKHPSSDEDVYQIVDSPEGNEQSTKEMDELIASISKPPSSKISPEKSRNFSPSPELSHTPGSDPFSMLKAMQADQDGDGSSPFDLFKAMQQGSQTEPGASPFGAEPVDQEMLKYHNHVINKLKSHSILLKWIFFLLPYVYIVIKPTESLPFELPQWLTNPSNFFTIFVAFEIVATSIYYQKLQSFESKNKIDTLQQNSKIAKLVAFIPNEGLPIANVRDKIFMALHYWDVLSMFITDICFVLILMGIFTYI